VDFRKYDEFMLPINRTYDEKDFARNPVGPVEGCGDRFHIDIYKEKFRSHLYALKHILNTGQGVVMEGCPASDYAYFDAAYNQGWIDRESRKAYKEACRMSLHRLMRPNLYIYLDAPVDVAMKNMADRGNEWDKD
jgi:thymidylate kinase